MTHAIIRDGAPVELFPGLPFTDAEGWRRQGNWLALSTPEEIAAAGVLAIVEPPEAPKGKVNVKGVLRIEDGRVVRGYAVEDAPAPAVPEVISDRQFAQVLALDGVISQDEALAWAARGDLPSRLTDALTKIPEDSGQRFGARMMLSAATTYERHHPLVPMLGALLGMDAAALDQIWRTGAAL